MLHRTLFGLVLAASTLSPTSSTAECADYTANLHWLGGCELEGHVNSAVFDGDLLYVAVGCDWMGSCSGALRIYDAGDPLAPVLLGELALPGSGRDLVVSSAVAYVAESVSGLVTVDVTDPGSPTLLASWSSLDGQDVAVDGSTAYLLTEDTLYSLDVTDPGIPVLLDSLPQGGNGMAVGQDHAFVFPGLTVIDLSDPSDLTLVVEDVIVESPPGDPLQEGQATFFGDRLYATYCFEIVATEYQQETALVEWDVSDPTNPVVIASAGRLGGTQGVRLAVGASEVFTNWHEEDGLGYALTSVSTDGSTWSDTGSWDVGATEIQVVGDDVFVFGADEMQLFRAGPLGGETLLGTIDAGAGAGLVVQGNHAFLANDAFDPLPDRLEVVDVTDATAPVSLGAFLGSSPWPIVEIDSVDEDHLTLLQVDDLSLANRIDILDVSDPGAPALAGSLEFSDVWSLDLIAQGSFAYVPAWDPFGNVTVIEVVDLSDLESPSLASSVPVPDWAWGGVFSGSYLATIGKSWLSLFSEDVPGSLSFLASLDLSPYVLRDIVALDDHVYVHARVDDHDYLLTVDITDPSLPLLVSELLMVRGGILGLDGALLSVAGQDYYDLRQPAQPVPVPGFRDGRSFNYSAVRDGRLYATRQYYAPFGEPTEVLNIYDLPCLSTADVPPASGHEGDVLASELAPWPNPASGVQRLRFRLPAESTLPEADLRLEEATVRVFGPSGRLVRSLAVEQGQSGELWAHWDGADAGGHQVAPGVYWTRLVVSGRTLEGRALRLR